VAGIEPAFNRSRPYTRLLSCSVEYIPSAWRTWLCLRVI